MALADNERDVVDWGMLPPKVESHCAGKPGHTTQALVCLVKCADRLTTCLMLENKNGLWESCDVEPIQGG